MTETIVGHERLRELYAMLTGVPKERFGLNFWRTNNVNYHEVDDVSLLQDCGTAGCAMGWACAYPLFKEQGLQYGFDGNAKPHFNGRSGYRAASEFFAITPREAEWLFSPDDYTELKRGVRPSHVRARILRLLLNKSVISRKRFESLMKEERLPASVALRIPPAPWIF